MMDRCICVMIHDQIGYVLCPLDLSIVRKLFGVVPLFPAHFSCISSTEEVDNIAFVFSKQSGGM